MIVNYTQTEHIDADPDELAVWLKALLHDEVATITFTKADGSVRKMKCTTREEHIPKKHFPKGTGSENTNELNIRVFDLEKIGWRSFNMDTVTAIDLEFDSYI